MKMKLKINFIMIVQETTQILVGVPVEISYLLAVKTTLRRISNCSTWNNLRRGGRRTYDSTERVSESEPTLQTEPLRSWW
jgi:hypothetical protein